MDKEIIVEAYRKTMEFIYKPKNYLERCYQLIKKLPSRIIAPAKFSRFIDQMMYIRAFLISIAVQGFSKYGYYYVKFLLKTLIVKPMLFPKAVQMTITGHHFFKLTKSEITDKIECGIQLENYLKKVITGLQLRLNKIRINNLSQALKWVAGIDIIHSLKVKYASVYETSNESIKVLYQELDDKLKKYLSVMVDTIKVNAERFNNDKIKLILIKLNQYRNNLVNKLSLTADVRNKVIRAVFDNIQTNILNAITETELILMRKKGIAVTVEI